MSRPRRILAQRASCVERLTLRELSRRGKPNDIDRFKNWNREHGVMLRSQNFLALDEV
ncbi:MAG: hypothetical protein AAF152_00410 [Cyanobacteria bacterium P01_A01_bin.114]